MVISNRRERAARANFTYYRLSQAVSHYRNRRDNPQKFFVKFFLGLVHLNPQARTATIVFARPVSNEHANQRSKAFRAGNSRNLRAPKIKLAFRSKMNTK
jgi:hypothetical protein